MDQEICPLVDSINIINSLDNDLENQMSKNASEDNAGVNEEESNDVIDQTPESTNDNFVDTNDENVNINQDANDAPTTKTKKVKSSDSNEINDFANRPCQYALARIKAIMKMDPELLLASKESVFLVAKATVTFFIKTNSS
jgi:hypothetical protein